MSSEENLTHENFILYAAKYYQNTSIASDLEFLDDLKHIVYIKRLLNRYLHKNELKYQLILNHITILYNLFGPKATTKMLFLKLEGYEKYFIPFLHFMNILPTYVHVNSKYINTESYIMDITILQQLKKEFS